MCQFTREGYNVRITDCNYNFLMCNIKLMRVLLYIVLLNFTFLINTEQHNKNWKYHIICVYLGPYESRSVWNIIGRISSKKKVSLKSMTWQWQCPLVSNSRKQLQTESLIMCVGWVSYRDVVYDIHWIPLDIGLFKTWFNLNFPY